MRLFITKIFIFFVLSGFSQYTEREVDLMYYKGLIEQARKFNLKSVTVLSSKGEGKKQWVRYHADFDKNGNIISLLDHPYKKDKDYETVNFKYDLNNRLIEYTQKQSFNKKSHHTYELMYDDTDSIIAIQDNFFYKNQFISENTLHRGYFGDPKVYWTSTGKRDTSYTFYNAQDSIIGRSYRFSERTLDQRRWDQNGCWVGYRYDTEMRTIILRDSNCRFLGYLTEVDIDGNWLPYDQEKFTYGKDTIASRSTYEWNYKKRMSPEEVQLILIRKMDFEYYSNGLLKRIVKTNKKGKLTSNEKYIYEFYDD